MAGMKTIIGLAFLLAVGILLVILSCALYGSVFHITSWSRRNRTWLTVFPNPTSFSQSMAAPPRSASIRPSTNTKHHMSKNRKRRWGLFLQ